MVSVKQFYYVFSIIHAHVNYMTRERPFYRMYSTRAYPDKTPHKTASGQDQILKKGLANALGLKGPVNLGKWII